MVQTQRTWANNVIYIYASKGKSYDEPEELNGMMSEKRSFTWSVVPELALAWKHAKEGKGNYYEVDGYLFRRDKILGESIGQLEQLPAPGNRSERDDIEKGCCSGGEERRSNGRRRERRRRIPGFGRKVRPPG
ncbi:hypothetical protein TNCV_72051 [Trichonephila clavipes]|nr:hypothetical protein TNCV_72051 [Trichonephila clavipes]